MNHLHSEFDLEAGDVVVVALDGRANVMLMDQINYGTYQNGQSYRY